MSLPDYENPPLSEVALGISFAPLDNLKIPHIGMYWNRIRHEYPQCEQMPPIGQQQINISKNWPVPMPRTWFISEDTSHLIQLQNGRFVLNWRKQTEEGQYPRYDALIESFWARLNEFREFIKQQEIGELQLQECELTYINHIFYNELMEAPQAISNILPDITWRQEHERFLPNPTPQVWQFRFDLPEDYGALTVDVKHATRTTDNVPVVILELSTKGLGQNKEWEAVRQWYDLSHEWIVNAFADMTSEEAQKKLWKKTDTG